METDDDFLEDESRTLASYGIGKYQSLIISIYGYLIFTFYTFAVDETEISFFVMQDYLHYKENPETKW